MYEHRVHAYEYYLLILREWLKYTVERSHRPYSSTSRKPLTPSTSGGRCWRFFKPTEFQRPLLNLLERCVHRKAKVVSPSRWLNRIVWLTCWSTAGRYSRSIPVHHCPWLCFTNRRSRRVGSVVVTDFNFADDIAWRGQSSARVFSWE